VAAGCRRWLARTREGGCVGSRDSFLQMERLISSIVFGVVGASGVSRNIHHTETAKRDFRFASFASFYLYYALRGEGRYFRVHFRVGLVRSLLSFLRRVGESRLELFANYLLVTARGSAISRLHVNKYMSTRSLAEANSPSSPSITSAIN